MEYNFVGYGSLLSHRSLSHTIKNKKFIPVIVKGYKRIFDLGGGKSRSDVLNLEEDKKEKFNGVLFSVSDAELRKIKKREDGYDMKSGEAYDFSTGKKLGKCLLVIDHQDIDYKKMEPDKDYFILCREAAYHISKKFGKFWDKTTFISDEERVSNWIKKHREFNTIK
ncbi:MAG: gamma-glutamylcyclotransferase family protein [Nanoarchaeota archaeon]